MKNPALIFDDVCLAPDRQIGVHAHNHWELSYVLCGAGTRTIGDTSEHFRQGEIILVPPGIPHVWQFDSRCTDSLGRIANICVFFDTETLKSLADTLPEYCLIINRIISQREAVCYDGETLDRISHLLLEMRALTAESRLPRMFDLLAAISDTDSCRKTGRNNMLSRTEQRLENVRIYCNCNFAREISLSEISAYAGMNKSAFCTFMRRHTGMSFSGFLNEIRLERAMEMLRHSDNSIAATAYDAGFTNVTYFNRRFRERFGCTPKSIKTAKLSGPDKKRD